MTGPYPNWPGPAAPAPWYPPPGYPPYPPPPMHPVWQPGVIPLRPLSLGDIFNGSVAYVRANPRATLGLTTVVVVVTGLFALAVQLTPEFSGVSYDDAVILTAGGAGAVAATALTTILLSGMLTVVVARAVMGSTISVTETWRRVRGRLLALVGLSVLEVAAVILFIAAAVLIVVAVAQAAGGGYAALVGVPLALLLIALLAFLFTMLTFAPIALVLERKTVLGSIGRSFTLARNHFWRILGIRVLATVVAGFAAGAVSVPFNVLGQILIMGSESTVATIVGATAAAIGQAVAQIITTPFTAGVVALLYVDARIRSEAFDFVLRGAGGADDDIWLTDRLAPS